MEHEVCACAYVCVCASVVYVYYECACMCVCVCISGVCMRVCSPFFMHCASGTVNLQFLCGIFLCAIYIHFHSFFIQSCLTRHGNMAVGPTLVRLINDEILPSLSRLMRMYRVLFCFSSVVITTPRSIPRAAGCSCRIPNLFQ